MRNVSHRREGFFWRAKFSAIISIVFEEDESIEGFRVDFESRDLYAELDSSDALLLDFDDLDKDPEDEEFDEASAALVSDPTPFIAPSLT